MYRRCGIIMFSLLLICQCFSVIAETNIPEAQVDRFLYGNEDNLEYSAPGLKHVDVYQYGTFGYAIDYQYDSHGRKTETLYIDSLGENNYKTLYNYSDEGLLVEVEDYSYREGKITSRKEIEYTDDGKPKLVLDYLTPMDGAEYLCSKNEYYYDNNGVFTEVKVYDEDQLRLEGVVSADDSGVVYSITWSNPEGNPAYQQYWEYDERKEIVSYTYQSTDYNYNYFYSYNESGKLAGADYFGYEHHYSVYSYDVGGNITKRQDYSGDDQPTSSYEYDYDLNGNLIEKRELDYSGVVLTKWVYTYSI